MIPPPAHDLDDQRRPRLLVVDDCAMMQMLVRHRLEDERIELHTASSGAEGLALARELEPDAILLDLEMNDLDGFEVLTALLEEPVTRDIPVLFISGHARTEVKVRALEMGAMDFIAKPFEVAELKARVRAAFRVRRLIRMLAQRAQIDGLTGLWNRAYFDARLDQEIALATRHDTPLALILADVDHFKSVNDRYGHPAGDAVLEEVARTLATGRSGDVVCRYGGEEFAIILPLAEAHGAAELAERLRRRFHETTWPGDVKDITSSFGVTDLARCPDATPDALIRSADQALYRAKHEGRDRVVVANGAESEVA